MQILVVNAGSSSIKLRLLDAKDKVVFARDLDAGGLTGHEDLGAAVGDLDVDAVGHRVVHGGRRFSGAAVVTDDVQRQIASLEELAPLHQAASLEGIAHARRVFPDRPHVACFDTAFHSTMPEAASTYAVPSHWREDLGIRRYGFHGLSHAYVSGRSAEMIGRPVDSIRIVTCHLGAGASLAAVVGGRSVDTTMGFTPLEGLVMASRSGSIDPSIPLWLQDRGLPLADVRESLERGSGLVGLAGTADMRQILGRAAQGDERAVLARDVYVHALAGGIARMAASMRGIDALVFTGGVGERSSEIRARASDGLGFLGVRLDESRNRKAAGDVDISAAGAGARALVVQAREELQIAREIRELLQ